MMPNEVDINWHEVKNGGVIIEATADEVRELIGQLDDGDELLMTTLDEAQAAVFTGEAETSYVLIRIVK